MQVSLKVCARSEFRMVEEGLDDLVLECEELESRLATSVHATPRETTLFVHLPARRMRISSVAPQWSSHIAGWC